MSELAIEAKEAAFKGYRLCEPSYVSVVSSSELMY